MVERVLRIVMPDHLSTRLAVLTDADRENDVVLMIEVLSEVTNVNHHVKKIAFLFSTMRHFAEALRSAGFTVRYVRLDDQDNTQTLDSEILRATGDLSPDRVVVTEPANGGRRS